MTNKKNRQEQQQQQILRCAKDGNEKSRGERPREWLTGWVEVYTLEANVTANFWMFLEF